MDEYAIVPARPEHVRALPAIERECARLFPDGAIPAPLLDAVLPEEALDDARLKGNLWVAENADGRPVGFGLLELHDGNALLAEMDVLPAHGRRGIGGRIVRCIAEKARLLGAPALFLTTFSNIPWNAPFYSRLGFVSLRKEDTPVWLASLLDGEREYGFRNRVAMRLDLPRSRECGKVQ